MTPDEIIEMAKEADVWVEEGFLFEDVLNAKTIAFAKLVAAKEREECAKIADGWSKRDDDVGVFIGKAIRARGES